MSIIDIDKKSSSKIDFSPYDQIDSFIKEISEKYSLLEDEVKGKTEKIKKYEEALVKQQNMIKALKLNLESLKSKSTRTIEAL